MFFGLSSKSIHVNMIFSWARLMCVMFNIWVSNSYFLLGPFVCWGLCSRHFLDELAESQRLRQRSSSLGRGQEELGSGGDPGPGAGPRSRGPGQRPMQLLVAAWPSEVSHSFMPPAVSPISILSHATKNQNNDQNLFSNNTNDCKLLLIVKCDMSPGEWQLNCETR